MSYIRSVVLSFIAPFFFSFIMVSVVYSLFFFLVLDRLFPLFLENRPISTVVTASDGTPLRAFADERGIWRYPASIDQVSPLYIQALLNYEDRWFYYHPGFNPLSVIRAAIQNSRAGRVVSGGSTLTMQVARIFFINDFNIQENGKGLRVKLLQLFRALQLELHFTKKEILNLYLTHAPFGSNIEGIKTAAYTWLGKDALELSHAEAALLAVLPQAPSYYRPDRHPERAKNARDKVLDRLEKIKVWSAATVADAKREPVVALRFTPPVIAPLAARRLHFQDAGESLIRTTLDFDLQVHIEEIVKNYVSSMPAQSGAALVVDCKSMEVMVYVGSADFTSIERKGHVDMIQAIRSPGSTLKPFLYGAAIDDGLIHSHSLLLDTPRFNAAYEPENFTGEFMGPVTVTEALRHSLNVPAVQVLEAYGPHHFHDRLKNGGATLEFQGRPNLSIILGGAGTNLESLVTLYTAFVRDGVASKAVMKIDSTSGRDEKSENSRYLLSPGAAWVIKDILTQPFPGYEGIDQLAGHVPVAWKTGTSYGFRDAWAVGIMGEYIAGVWVGRPDGTPVPGQYGAVTALPLLKRIVDSLPQSDFCKKMPDSVKKETICWPLGNAFKPHMSHCGSTRSIPTSSHSFKPHMSHCGVNCLKKYEAWIVEGKVPVTLIDKTSGKGSLLKTMWVNSRGERAQPSCNGVKMISVALWPESVDAWLPSEWKNRNRIPPPSPDCPDLASFSSGALQIASVGDESVILCPPGEDAESSSIPLTTIGGWGKIHWFLNRESVATSHKNGTVILPMPKPGRYQLVAADDSGESDMVMFSVISGR
ncbi:Penicillin-binding protein 1C (Includes: Penicillin-insensitive transglycosylase; Transpeptidase-like module) [Desulfamplus magnetovallimortis]|uniref:peptidoglycan glycosyltransferase n=1 Tax=Desulfamplus magnetovallimortis TaxID=1246637 RepID=A0A1W1HGP3_9BACT|nr:penicillin-binding protein 1C [Desulfamplus magnetovallimortis]SLM31558.1 Penicillin-binding protein 1C (Includes: Penicillin-insensitive transglycosylase; Transpeptidase-like module) [Desulfamplus magnetovallimortis]